MFETKITNRKCLQEPRKTSSSIGGRRQSWSGYFLIIKQLSSLILKPIKFINEVKYFRLRSLSHHELTKKVTHQVIEFLKQNEMNKVLNPSIKDSFEIKLDCEQGTEVIIHKTESHDYFVLLFRVADSVKIDQYRFLIPIAENWSRSIAFAKRDVISPFGSASFPEKCLLSKVDNALALLYIRDLLNIKIKYHKARIVSYKCKPDLNVL